MKLQKIEPSIIRRTIFATGEFSDVVAVQDCLTINQVKAGNAATAAENTITHRVSSIKAVDESGEIIIYGKTQPNNVVPKSRAMIRRNISESEGLVNEATGTVKK